MALTRTKTGTKKYDDEECWNLAMSWGAAFTTNKLHRWHKENKGFGSHMGGIWAMWRWAAKNPELCYPQYKKWYFESASDVSNEVIDPNASFEEFLEDIRRHAHGKDSILSKKAYKQWCVKYGLED